MSLKHFHVVFIALVLGLMSFISYWSGSRLLSGQDSAGLLAASAVGFLAGLAYLRWFFKEYRALK